MTCGRNAGKVGGRRVADDRVPGVSAYDAVCAAAAEYSCRIDHGIDDQSLTRVEFSSVKFSQSRTHQPVFDWYGADAPICFSLIRSRRTLHQIPRTRIQHQAAGSKFEIA